METSLNVIDYPESKEQNCYVFECDCSCKGRFYVYADSEEEARNILESGNYDDKEYDDYEFEIESIVGVRNDI